MSLCPCGGGTAAYETCCQPLHDGTTHALTAEQLMRSRYAAFVKHRADYLLQTLHPSICDATTQTAIEASFANTHWQSLKIIEATPEVNKMAEVEFVAFFTTQLTTQASANAPEQLHERSRFVLENSRWYYVDGEHLPPIKLGRNDPCWCGSGKKLKKCHLPH